MESEESTTTNVASHLPAMARRQPDALAVAFLTRRGQNGEWEHQDYTFRQLDEESNKYASGLENIGIRRGVRTVLMVKPSLEFFALTFAIFKTGAVPVLIDPGMGLKNLKQCLAEAQPEAFIGISKAHLARLALGWARDSLRMLVTVGRKVGWGGTTLRQVRELGADAPDYRMAETAPGDVAAILFTSGSTGPPKGALYTHRNFDAQVRALKQLYEIQPGEVDLPTFPLFALFDPALGMSAIIPRMDFTRPGSVEPQNIIEPIRQFNITNMFGSPALIRRVGIYGRARNMQLPSLKRVISAGAPVPALALQRFSSMLGQGAELYTPYGATESLPVASIGSQEILEETQLQTERGRGVCVGRPIPDARVAVIRITDSPIPEWSKALLLPQGEIGEIVVRSPMTTSEYLNRPEATRLAKIPDPENNCFYHRMGDVGYFDEKGRVWFCGRKSHRVITAGGTLFPVMCEGIFNTHERIARSALVGVGSPGDQAPVLCLEMEKRSRKADSALVRKEMQRLAASQPVTSGIQTFLIHPKFPVDIRHNAKIFREKLANWSAVQLKGKLL